jgi:hypothetical protein
LRTHSSETRRPIIGAILPQDHAYDVRPEKPPSPRDVMLLKPRPLDVEGKKLGNGVVGR